MLGKLIAFDKNGSDIKTMMECMVIIHEFGANDSISRFQYKRNMELYIEGETSMPENEPDGYLEASRNWYNKSKFLRMFGFVGLVASGNKYDNLVLTKRGQALLNCINYSIDVGKFSYSIIPNKENEFVGLFIDGLVYGSFGKNNVGLETTNTDIEYPKIILKSMMTLDYLTSGESFYIADGMNQGEHNSFEEALQKLTELRKQDNYKSILETKMASYGNDSETSKGRTNYADDNKMFGLLEQLKIIELIKSDETGLHKRYRLTDNARKTYASQFQLILPVYRPIQMIISGVPGTGKSYYVENKILGGNSNPNNVIRTIIHPEYTYSDFIGYIRPKSTDFGISYIFNPGPSTKALERCFQAPRENVYLVIEEMNRGDFASIMGDTFQLLDRIDDFASDRHGWSEYFIENTNIYEYLLQSAPKAVKLLLPKNKIAFPSNLHIIGTMNTADQNVFILDTAFRRRFRNLYLRIDFSTTSDIGSYLNMLDEYSKVNVFDGKHTWSQFALLINRKIDEINAEMYSIPEDKKLAPYFVDLDDVSSKQAFCDKVMYYLKNDVFMYIDNFMMDSYEQMYNLLVLSKEKISPYEYIEGGGNLLEQGNENSN